MPVLHFSTQIDSPSETIFALIADLTHYNRWLPSSRAFGAVTQVSHTPIVVGTAYVDTGPSGAMHGSITDYESAEAHCLPAIHAHQVAAVRWNPGDTRRLYP